MAVLKIYLRIGEEIQSILEWIEKWEKKTGCRIEVFLNYNERKRRIEFYLAKKDWNKINLEVKDVKDMSMKLVFQLGFLLNFVDAKLFYSSGHLSDERVDTVYVYNEF